MTFNDSELAGALQTAVRSTLENMLFVEAEPVEDVGSLGAETVHGYLDVHEPMACKVTLQTSNKLASRLAQELHGVEDAEFVPQMALDTLGELLNTVAGLIFSELDEELPIGLGLPTTGYGELEQAASSLRQCFQVEHSVLSVCVSRAVQ